MTTLLNPYFGEFGGMYVPQILMPALRQLEEAFVSAQKDPEFQAQFNDLLKNYAGRPTALTKCQNITAGTNTTLYLKREDLLHGGAHKTNQVLGQALLAKRMGKTEIIAETGAGQHGDQSFKQFGGCLTQHLGSEDGKDGAGCGANQHQNDTGQKFLQISQQLSHCSFKVLGFFARHHWSARSVTSHSWSCHYANSSFES